MTVLWESDPATARSLEPTVGGVAVGTVEDLYDHLSLAVDENTVLVGPSIQLHEALKLAESLRVGRPSLGVVLVRHEVDTRLLTDALRAGIREVVPLEATTIETALQHSAELSSVLRQQVASSAPPSPAATARGHVVTVFSAKGGCGKTTLATNLAAALADRGRRQVCLVDLDLAFGDVGIALQLFPAHTIADAVPIAGTLDATALQALLTPHSPGLSILVAPLDPGTADTVPAVLVARILDLLRTRFEFIVVDTPPAFDDQVLAAFDVSDVIALMATLDVPALKNLKVTLETMELLNYPSERWQIVLNRADSRVGLSLSEVEKTLRTSIALHIPSSRDVPAAVNRGVPIIQDDPKHPVSVAIRGFAERHAASLTAARDPEPMIPKQRKDKRGFRRRKGKG